MRPRTLALLLIALLLFSLQLACLGSEAVTTQEASTSQKDSTTQESGALPLRTAMPGAPSGDGKMCLGTVDAGVSCLDASGWASYTSENSDLPSSYITDLALCPDGSMVVAHSAGISTFDGQNWTSYAEGWGLSMPDHVACGSQGDLWVGHFQGVHSFNGTTWTEYPSALFASGADANDLVEDLTIAPDGKVWVVTANSLASFDGNAWNIYQQGQGWDSQRFFGQVAADAAGQIWAADSDGLLRYDGSAWTPLKNDQFITPSALAIDSAGQPWVGTIVSGVFHYDNNRWTDFTQEESLSSDSVRALALDSANRAWVGTSYGLSVFDGSGWTTYRMDNSPLGDNDVRAIVVSAGGPPLPALEQKAPGSLIGSVTHEDGSPLANAPIEACVETIGSSYFGDTPCSDQPYMQKSVTGADGSFNLTGLLPGYYVITVDTGSGWAVLTGDFGGISERVLVNPGEDTRVGEIQLQPD